MFVVYMNNINLLLIDACKKNDLDQVKSLVKKGANISYNNYEVLHLACYLSDNKILSYLFDELNTIGEKTWDIGVGESISKVGTFIPKESSRHLKTLEYCKSYLSTSAQTYKIYRFKKVTNIISNLFYKDMVLCAIYNDIKEAERVYKIEQL